MHDAPYPGAEPPPRPVSSQLPPADYLARGAALGIAALFALRVAIALVQKSALLAPVAIVPLAVAVLAAWGSVVQFVGGQKYDDHPWV